MRNFDIWTCGHTTYRLKDTIRRLPDGNYQVLSAVHVFHDYPFSTDQKSHCRAERGLSHRT